MSELEVSQMLGHLAGIEKWVSWSFILSISFVMLSLIIAALKD